MEPQIQFTLALDLGRQPRMNCSETTQIVVHKQKQARQVERLMIVTTAKLWGGSKKKSKNCSCCMQTSSIQSWL